jgi:hypothetical protein
MENSLDVPQKLNIKLSYNLTIPFLSIYIQNNWKWHSNWCICMNVHCIIIHSSPKVETTQMFTNRWMENSVIFIYNEIFLAIKRNKLWYILQHRWVLKTLCWLNWTRHKRTNIIWLQLCKICKIDKFLEKENRLAITGW